MTASFPHPPVSFATCDADELRDHLIDLMRKPPADDCFSVFRARAVALIGTMTPVLVWMRDHEGVPIDLDRVRYAMQLGCICTLVTRKVFLARDAHTGAVGEHHVPGMPADLLDPLQAYVGEIPGYDTSRRWCEQRTEKPIELHSYALFYLTHHSADAAATNA